jgi:putative ABC transport system permease protein
MSHRAGPIGIALRATTTSPALTVFAIVVVGVTALVGAAAPGWLQRVQSDSLHYALNSTGAVVRDFTADERGTPIPGSGRADDLNLPDDMMQTWGAVAQELADARAGMEPELRDVLGPARVVTDFDPVEAFASAAGTPRSMLTIRYDPHLEDLVTWVQGDEPRADPEGPTQFGLSAPVAEAMAWTIGEVREVRRPGDVMQRVVLTGIWEAVDPTDVDWQHTPYALQPGLLEQGLAPPLHLGVGYAAPRDLDTPIGLSEYTSTSAWYPLDVPAIGAAGARELIAAMRLFTAVNVEPEVTAESYFITGLSFSSTAPVTMTQALVRIEAMSALVALIASGPLAVAIVVLALTSRMLALRRRNSLQLAEARGASVQLRAGVLAAEGLAIGLIGGVGGGIAGGVLGGGTGPVLALVPAIVGLTPFVVLPVTGLLVARRRSRADLGSGSGSAARWRLVAEAAVVLLAAAATVLVLMGSRSSDGGAPDPLITALPLLLAAVGCVITLRLVPLLLGLVERGVPSRRGLIALVGPARARRDPAVRVAPVLAVVVGVAIAVFSVAFSSTVDAGIRVAARSGVGADLRVTGPYLNQDQLDALAAIDGVAATAPVYADEQRAGELPTSDLTVMVYVIDVAELRSVQTDPETAIVLPDALLGGGDPVPVIASDELAARTGGEALVVEGDPVDIVGTAPSLTPLGSNRNWIAVDRSRASEVVLTTFSPAVVLIRLEPGADAVQIAAEARDIVGAAATAETPESVSAERLQDPALVGLQVALLAAIGVVAALLALAIGMTLVLGAPARGRLLALLAAVGFRRSKELAIVVWEVAPAVAVALPIGAAAGFALPLIVVPSLDVTGFIGGTAQPSVRFGEWAPALVVLGFLAVTVLAVLVAALVARRVTSARTLRSIDEEG